MPKLACAHGPETRYGFPVWCHRRCIEMKLTCAEGCMVKIASRAARVLVVAMPEDLFFVDWEIVFARNAKVNGRVVMTQKELSSAFGLSEKSGIFGDWIVSQYGADVAEQGKYIRWGDYLNIPGPGTGSNGDPNISIKLDSKTKDAIQVLLERPA